VAEYDSVIPAGGSGKVTAKVRTAQTQKGKLTKSVSVMTDAPSSSSLRLVVTFEVMPAIDILPKRNLFLAGMVGEEATAVALLHRTDGKPLKVTGVEAAGSEGLVEIEIEPYTDRASPVEGVKGEEGDVWVVARLSPQSLQMTRAVRVFLTTDHPEMERLEIPLSIRVQSLIVSAPRMVRLLASENPGHRQQTTLRLTHTRGKEFSVLGVKSADPELFSVEVISTGKLKMHSLKVVLAKGLDLDALDAVTTSSLEVTTDDPGLPRLEVTVRVDSLGTVNPKAGSAAGVKQVPARPGRAIQGPQIRGGPGSFRRSAPPRPAPAPTAAPTPVPVPTPESPS